MTEKLILIVGAGLHGADLVVLDGMHMTAPLEIGPPPIVISLKREDIKTPEIDVRMLREPKKRDWEQRNRKRRR